MLLWQYQVLCLYVDALVKGAFVVTPYEKKKKKNCNCVLVKWVCVVNKGVIEEIGLVYIIKKSFLRDNLGKKWEKYVKRLSLYACKSVRKNRHKESINFEIF